MLDKVLQNNSASKSRLELNLQQTPCGAEGPRICREAAGDTEAIAALFRSPLAVWDADDSCAV